MTASKPPQKSGPRPPAAKTGAPARGPRPQHGRAPSGAAAPSAPPDAWSDDDLDELQSLLDEVPAPLEPLDASMLDGFLVAVILQPKPVPLSDWWRWVLDAEEGRPAPARYDAQPLLQLVQRRERELKQAIADRQWFDPWVFELDEDASPSETVLPWVAGFALAADLFPALMNLDESELTEPLAQLYMHLDPEDLEDADALLEEIESLEPPEELDEAVESLVRATLLLADVSRPQPKPQRPGGHGGPGGPRRGGPPPRRQR
ncbi:YecA family protein [Mitsuaria sp. GD03876]|uniref:YecA/YgfB family protein n=1 Tax=Mitsuaria sp. GD03876 TaxID=2975399 RepID=UPI00244740DE|nr:YecA family protein [Mitsuaria sp. GD03876]MDH0862947.1 YecA family protein [Mitsuaria sp. GD03876]